MKLQILSDLHLEFQRTPEARKGFVESLVTPDVDVLILAGDIATPSLIEEALEHFCALWPQVIYVPGNHELYGTSKADWSVQSRPNLHLLQESCVEIGGLRFAGTTLWFREDPLSPKHRLSDFRRIRDFDPYAWNLEAERFLHQLDPMPDIIITHHLPSQICVAPQYRGDPLNSFFVAPVAEDMVALPRLWVFGHTHSGIDVEQNDCRFLCNPAGYPGENSGFDPHLTLEMHPQ